MFTVISQFPEWKSVKDNSTRSLFQIKSSCREHAQPNNNSDFDHFIVILCPVSISDQKTIAPKRYRFFFYTKVFFDLENAITHI